MMRRPSLVSGPLWRTGERSHAEHSPHARRFQRPGEDSGDGDDEQARATSATRYSVAGETPMLTMLQA